MGVKVREKQPGSGIWWDPEEKEIPTFKAYAERWLELHVKPLRRQSTYERYQQILQRRVFPKTGRMPLDTITRGDIRTLLMSLLAEGLSWASVCLVRDVISGPMSYAVDEELIPANPISGILKRAVMKRDQDNEIDPLPLELASYGHFIPSSNRDQVNLLDTQPAATYPQPAEREKA